MERAALFAPYAAKARTVSGDDAFRWLVEEFRVSVFAQELGTAEPVSAVKLERALKTAPAVASQKVTAVEKTAPAAATAPLASTEKKPPLKNLGALDKLFRR